MGSYFGTFGFSPKLSEQLFLSGKTRDNYQKRRKIHWQMVRIKHFTALRKMPDFQFSKLVNWLWRDKILSAYFWS